MKKIKKLLVILLTMVFIISACASVKEDTNGTAKMQGTVTVIKKGKATIHSYLSPEQGGYVCSQIIESKNKIVIIDAQFMRAYAKELRTYAESLKKPIARIIITHSHPDHWFGLEFFSDVPVYSLKETAQEIQKFGDMMVKDKRSQMGDLVTDKTIIPQRSITKKTEMIDGLKYRYQKLMGAEAHSQLLIKLPQINTLVAQDLVYNKAHLFLGNNSFTKWFKIIKKLSKLTRYNSILAGHGKPAQPSIYKKMANYLKATKLYFKESKNGQQFKSKLVAKYPSYKATFLLDIAIKMLYTKQN